MWFSVAAALNAAFRDERQRDLNELNELYPEGMANILWSKLSRV